MGEVTGSAAVDAEGGVFKDKRAAFVDVAFEAGFFVLQPVGHHARAGGHAPGGGVGAMGIVAVGALHEAFVDAVFDGHGELGLNVGVAGIAEVGLRTGEKLLGGSGFVDGMAVGANDIGGGVRGAADVGARDLPAMTRQAGVEGLFGLELGKGNDLAFVAFGFDVSLAGAVAAFAAFVFEREFGVVGGLEVRIAEESR